MKIEIIKPFRLLEVGKQLNIDAEYAANLIKKGFAKSLEVVEVVAESETIEVEKPKATKKVK